MLLLAAVAASLSCPGTHLFAGPRIDVSFEADATERQKLIHARAEFAARPAVVYKIFDSITSYPTLHDWIRQTTLVRTDGNSQEFRVEFAFPWPVGRQWSRVEVRHDGNTIAWKQVDGSLKANRGHIRFTTVDNKTQIDYCAAIDIGLPELWTRSYKEQFIREFLTAADAQARMSEPSSRIVLAVEP
jgi:hypothetical protein